MYVFLVTMITCKQSTIATGTTTLQRKCTVVEQAELVFYFSLMLTYHVSIATV